MMRGLNQPLNIVFILSLSVSISFTDAFSSSAETRTNSIIPVEVMYDSSQYLHRCIDYHPEQPDRITTCVETLLRHQKENPKTNYNVIDVFPDAPKPDAMKLTDEELRQARDILTKIHSEEYVHQFEEKCRNSRQKRIEEGKAPLGFIGYIDPDTFLTTESYDVFLRATAIWIRAVKNVISPTFKSLSESEVSTFGIRSSMALTRPPGHHATRKLANGFCVFNFAAAAAKYAIESGLASRVSIFDWDVHYGQGVADIISEAPQIRYASMHQYHAFPYLGEDLKVSGKFGNILTVPILPGMTWEGGYEELFQNMALPFIYSEDEQKNSLGGKWVPDLIIICAGYDALATDELASVNLDPIDFGTMVQLIKNRIGGGSKENVLPPGLVLGLEGGYQLSEKEKGLSAAVMESVKALCE